MVRNITDEQFTELVAKSLTKREVLRGLGMKAPGGYRTLDKHLLRLGLSISHFRARPSDIAPKRIRSDEETFCEESTVDYNHIRRRVIREHLVPYLCALCHLVDWQGQPLALHLDHINGVKNDHRLVNLRFLCPNCHSQTDTYCGKNIKGACRVPSLCACGKLKTRRANSCWGCFTGITK